MADNSSSTSGQLSRRNFLKIGGAAGAALSLGGIAGAAYNQGKSYDSYTGWEDIYEGGAQFFDRKPFEVDKPTYEVVGDTRRIDNRTEVMFTRHGRLKPIQQKLAADTGWTADVGLATLVTAVLNALPDADPVLADYYGQPENQDKLELDLLRQTSYEPQQKIDQAQYGMQWALAMAWGSAWGAVNPASPTTPAEEWDFRNIRGSRTEEVELADGRKVQKLVRDDNGEVIRSPLPFKGEALAAELIKKVAHTFGATLVGITRLNPDWVYGYDMRGGQPGPYEVPAWWEYAIVVTTPHEWDQMLGNPTYGTTSDAYARSSIAGARLAAYIRSLGYPARLHSPNNGYDLVVPPICIDAGLGQQGRHVYSIAPELGSNHRPAVVTTSLPMQVDKPIDFGVHEFCKKCKICADQCPSGAISFADEPDTVVRGYKRWELDHEACYNFWGQVLGNTGCRVCLAVCPYSRKDNWVHQMSRNVSAADPTGLVDTGLIWMQENFFDAPNAKDYYPPEYGGTNASYRVGPTWMRSEDYLDVSKSW